LITDKLYYTIKTFLLSPKVVKIALKTPKWMKIRGGEWKWGGNEVERVVKVERQRSLKESRAFWIEHKSHNKCTTQWKLNKYLPLILSAAAAAVTAASAKFVE
jgi:hypothetical protein